MKRLIAAVLGSPLQAALVAAALLSVPGLFLGFFMDDYVHLLIQEGLRAPGKPFDLFAFATGNPAELAPFIQKGPYPWWTHPDLRLSFWRPLSSALFHFEHQVFGRAALGYHLHSLAWHLLFVLAGGLLLRRTLPGRLGSIAILLFAIAGVHWVAASWIANRNALVAAGPALLGVLAHVRWREAGWRPGLPLSVLAVAVGLSGGESAIAVCAYVLAYELLAAPGTWRRRAASLVPLLALGAVYVVAYRKLGYGAWGSAIYVDPVTTPGAFLLAAPARLLALIGCEVLGVPADLWIALASGRVVLVLAGAVSAGLVVFGLRRALPTLEPAEQRGVKWLAVGSVLALVPVLATFPANRLLLVCSLGASAVIAVLLQYLWSRPGVFARAGFLYLFAVHVPLAMLAWLLQPAFFGTLSRRADATFRSAEMSDDGNHRYVMVAAPDPATAIYLPLIRVFQGQAAPQAYHLLSMAPYPHRFTRTAPDAFEVEVLGGQWLTTVFEQLMRADYLPLNAGHTVALAGLTVTVLEAQNGKPTRVGFRADRPLEEPPLYFLQWKDGGVRRFHPPAVGQSVELAFSRGLMSQ